MELNKELVSIVASTFGITAEEFTAKITSDKPQELKLAGQLFTDEELKARDSGKYNEGKTVGSERPVKDLKKKYGYELDGVKDIEGFLAHHEEQLKVKYSKGGNERVTELESDLKKMKETYETEIEGLKTINSDYEGKYKKQTITNKLLSVMPKDTSIKKDALVTLFNTDYEVDVVDGMTVVKKGGEILKDAKTTSPLALESVFNEWMVTENYIAKPSGRGEGNEFGQSGNYKGLKTPQDFQSKWLKENPDKNVNSPEYQKAYEGFREEQKKTA